MCLLALALGALACQFREPVTVLDGAVALPAGPVAELLGRLPPDVAPRPPGPPWPAWSDRSPQGWGGEPAWRRWVELVRAEAAAVEPDAARRAQLAVLARLQGRDGDGWAHLLACAGEPALVAAVLPCFTPGVPQEALDPTRALEDGVLLAPALPPCDDPRAGLRWLAGSRIERRELAVGAARIALSVTVDRDGLEVGLRHLGGGAARVRVLPPLPRGIDPGLTFADWEKLPGHQGPVEFALDPADPEHSLWLTFHPPAERWPNPRIESLQRPAPGRELVLASSGGDEAHLARCAEALAELFGIRATLRAEGFRAEGALEPLVVQVGAGPAGERKLVQLLGLAEAFLLSRPGR